MAGKVKPEKRILNCENVQGVYADLLRKFTIFGIVFLGATFAVYFLQLIPSYVDIAAIPSLVKMKSAEYIAIANIPRGWGWIDLISYSDYISFAGIVFLASVSIFVYLILVRVFIHCKDYVYGAIVFVQILVFVLAASGLIRAGH